MYTKVTTFFIKLFSNKILENEIVSTVLYVISVELEKFKIKMNNNLNTDI